MPGLAAVRLPAVPSHMQMSGRESVFAVGGGAAGVDFRLFDIASNSSQLSRVQSSVTRSGHRRKRPPCCHLSFLLQLLTRYNCVDKFGTWCYRTSDVQLVSSAYNVYIHYYGRQNMCIILTDTITSTPSSQIFDCRSAVYVMQNST